jgi:colicin import membrane protein
MVRDNKNMIPVTMALLLHVLVFGALFVAVDLRARATPVVPMAIKGTLVPENAVVVPPKVEEPPPKPEPEPEPEPDTSEQDRLRAEEKKRIEDARVEQDRLNRIRKAEEEAAAERQRVADAEKRRKDEEVRKERERQEAERVRLAEIERQREENARLKAESEAARQAELDAESNRLVAMQADAKAAYAYAIRQRIMNRWVQPPTATAGIECIVNIRQLPGGEVVSVSIGRCNGDAAVQRSIEAAVQRASPLPAPEDPSVFSRDIQLEFRPTAE